MTPPAPGFQVGTFKGTTVVNPKGMEVDLAKDIARKLGLKKIEWYYQASFPKSYAPGPKPYDLYFGEETITPERSKNVDYSIPYIDADQGAMVRKGLTPAAEVDRRPQEAHALRAGRHDGRRLHQGPHQAHQGALPEHDLDHVPAAAVEAVRRGHLRHPDPRRPRPQPTRQGTEPIVGRIVTHEQYGIVFQKGSKLRAVVNPVLKGLIKDGTVGKLQKKWLAANFAELPIFK